MEADIIVHCLKDSLDEKSCEEFREDYFNNNVRDGMFRIRVSLESGFSPKSMEHDHWALYIENTRGIQIEPAGIICSDIKAVQDSVYSEYRQANIPRSILRRDITLSFERTTFFGEDLFGSDNQYILFVMSHKQNTVARVGWKLSGKTK